MPDYQYIRSITSPVFKNHGYTLTIKNYSNKETLKNIKNRTLDGDCGRPAFFNKRFGLNLHKVEPAFRTAVLALWAIEKTAAAVTPENLRVGHLTSATLFAESARQAGYTNLKAFNSYKAMLSALKNKSIDSIATYEAAIHPHQDKYNLIKIKQLAALPIFLYLQPDLKHLSNDLAKAISQRKTVAPYSVNTNQPLPTKRNNNEMIFGCSSSKNSQIFKTAESFYGSVFKEMGYTLTMVALPRAREIAELNKGILDGTCARGNYPPFNQSANLIKLKTPIATVTYEVIATTPQPPFQHPADIPKGKRIAFVRGSPIADKLLEKHPAKNRIPVTNVDIGMKMLAARRIDYYVDFYESYSEILHNENFSTAFFSISNFDPTPLYPYINKRHQHIKNTLEAEINAQLSDDNRIRMLFDNNRDKSPHLNP